MGAIYNPINDLWTLTWTPGEGDTSISLEPLPDGDFNISALVQSLPITGGIGLYIKKADGERLFFTLRTNPLPDIGEPHFAAAGPEVPQGLKLEYHSGTVYFAYGGYAGASFTNVQSMAWPQPVEAGLILQYDPGSGPVTGIIGGYRLQTDRYGTSSESMAVGRMGTREPSVTHPVATAEAMVHALVGATFGDQEWDVGKSVRWTQWFVDDVFITDINYGDQRYWVVNWEATYPEVFHDISGTNYFVVPAQFRQEQFAEARKRLIMDNTDWVLWVDAHEGMSIDLRSKPDDYLIEPFRSYIYREIARAEDDGVTSVVLPFFAFLGHKHIQNVEYALPGLTDDFGDPRNVVQAVGVPYYIPQMGLPRLIRADVLKDPAFDWASLDTPVPINNPAVKIQIVSYAYAHWTPQDIVPPATSVPALDADNDQGWHMRNNISRVRPIPGLPIGEWQPPENDPPGEPGPWALDYVEGVDALPVPDPPPGPTANTEGVQMPLYDTVFRINLRDGLYYEREEQGTVPLVWNDETQEWEPKVDPVVWHNTSTYVVS